jgi:hypothetical protein
MSKTVHTIAQRSSDGYVKIREPRPAPRRQSTRDAILRAASADETDRVAPGVRKPYLSRSH